MSENPNLSSAVAAGILKAVAVILLLVLAVGVLRWGVMNVEDQHGNKVFAR